MENLQIDEAKLNELGLNDLAEKKGMFDEFMGALPEKLLGLGIRALIVAILFFIGFWLIRLFRKILKRSLKRSKVAESSIVFIDHCVKIVLFAFLILALAGYFGVDAASVVALIGSGALTIGLAFQGSLSNFAGGVLILICKPFVTGDYIFEKNTQTEGNVVQINLFYTRIKTPDNRLISIPNAALSNATIIDASALPERRVDLFVPVSYETKVEEAREVILEKVLSDERVLDHDRNVFVEALENNNVLLGVQFYVKTEDYLSMKRFILEQIKKEFDNAGIIIPFEQIDVHMI
ncbi:MAG: mechanosensitive ion channel family protein [Lachnospiraceae bacterium]|nr:mechanosensitive ion channel family protein [Lachnospiraceae bacterium]